MSQSADSQLIISVSGLRGIVGAGLTPDSVLRYVAAFARVAPPGAIGVAFDGRTTGPHFARQAICGLNGVGRDVVDLGVASTPTVGVAVRHFGLVGAVQVSASHNPPEYNGLKLFSPEGRVVSAQLGERVKHAFTSEAPAWVGHTALGTVRSAEDPHQRHLELVLQCVDVEAIRAKKFRVVLDANHGAGSILGERLLWELGCEVVLLGGTPDGRFAHPPEPTAENLVEVASRVASEKADVGFCQDPDADRLAVVDGSGRYIGEEYTLALCVDQVLRSRPGPVVTNCSTSRMVEDLAKKFGVPFHRSAVGEANVVEAMRAHQAILGGEGNGGVIDPRVGWVRDSFLGMAFILEGLARRGGTLASWADEMPRYELAKRKATLAKAAFEAAAPKLVERFPEAAVDRMDGLRFDWPDRWLLIRTSNTEPIVRVFAEASTLALAEQTCDETLAVLLG